MFNIQFPRVAEYDHSALAATRIHEKGSNGLCLYQGTSSMRNAHIILIFFLIRNREVLHDPDALQGEGAGTYEPASYQRPGTTTDSGYISPCTLQARSSRETSEELRSEVLRGGCSLPLSFSHTSAVICCTACPWSQVPAFVTCMSK